MPMTWDSHADARLFAAVLKTADVKLNYQALAAEMGPECTPKAIMHRIGGIKARGREGPTAPSKPSTPTPTKPLPTKRKTIDMNVSGTPSKRGRKRGGGTPRGGRAAGANSRNKKQATPVSDDDDDDEEESDFGRPGATSNRNANDDDDDDDDVVALPSGSLVPPRTAPQRVSPRASRAAMNYAEAASDDAESDGEEVEVLEVREEGGGMQGPRRRVKSEVASDDEKGVSGDEEEEFAGAADAQLRMEMGGAEEFAF
ncbi:hypothetical protein EV356DRAFT_528992 [Viridothelium virens]|uniref:AT hook motif protein n=1 Tax=Viridothelium virens TaxID=1048519 RepID=A0A6A6HK66_VIRVR|nr:hypothetical protein EV356DRAFT_528992 [Viridothelium virens]